MVLTRQTSLSGWLQLLSVQNTIARHGSKTQIKHKNTKGNCFHLYWKSSTDLFTSLIMRMTSWTTHSGFFDSDIGAAETADCTANRGCESNCDDVSVLLSGHGKALRDICVYAVNEHMEFISTLWKVLFTKYLFKEITLVELLLGATLWKTCLGSSSALNCVSMGSRFRVFQTCNDYLLRWSYKDSSIALYAYQ